MRMGQPVRVGSYFFGDRELFLLDLARPEDAPEALALQGSFFGCLLAWDATHTTDESILTLARRLLTAGCVYICCWGPDCERVHDLIDQAHCDLNPSTGSVVMTTSHAEESLTEALWFLLNVAWPDPAFEDGCGSSVGIAIASGQWAAEIRAAFSDPSAFSARVLTSEEGPA